MTPTEPQATSNKEIKWQFQRTQQLQECLGYVRLPPCPSSAAWPLSLTPSYSTHSSPPSPPLQFSSLSLRNVPQPAKHNELLHLRSRCSIKSVLPYPPLPSPLPSPLHSLFAQFQFHCPFPSRSAHHFPFSALLFFISSKVSRLMF